MDFIQVPAECILFRRSRIVRNLDPGFVLGGVMINIEVRAFVKTVVVWQRSSGWLCEIVMNIGEPDLSSIRQDLKHGMICGAVSSTHKVTRRSSPAKGGIVM